MARIGGYDASFDSWRIRQVCYCVNRYFSEQVDSLRKSGHIDTLLLTILDGMSKPARIYTDAEWTDVDAHEKRVHITLPEGGTATAYPTSVSQTITFPRYLPGVRNVSVVWGVPNPQLGELMYSVARRISRGEMSAKAATVSFLETIEKDPDRWLQTLPGPLAALRWIAWVVSTGWKDDRRGRYTCWPIRFGHPLTVAVLRILRGEVSVRGVLPPEACFEPQPFFDEMVALMPDLFPDGKLFEESFEWLE